MNYHNIDCDAINSLFVSVALFTYLIKIGTISFSVCVMGQLLNLSQISWNLASQAIG